MSIKSQEGHMRQLALLLTTDLGCIFGERESGPNGSKKAFLNVGKVFLRALAKDLGLHEVTVSANSGGIAVSGTCSLYGMWEDRGIAVWIEQRLCADGKVLCYRTIRSSRDFKGGYPAAERSTAENRLLCGSEHQGTGRYERQQHACYAPSAGRQADPGLRPRRTARTERRHRSEQCKDHHASAG